MERQSEAAMCAIQRFVAGLPAALRPAFAGKAACAAPPWRASTRARTSGGAWPLSASEISASKNLCSASTLEPQFYTTFELVSCTFHQVFHAAVAQSQRASDFLARDIRIV